MISRLLILFIFILQSISANQFEKSSTKIIDIGSVSDVQAMEVPAEWVHYDGPSTQIPWAVVLEKRVESTESCIIDNLHRESCPIDAVVCDGSQQIDDGIIAASKRGRAMAHSMCDTGETYNPSNGFCEKYIFYVPTKYDGVCNGSLQQDVRQYKTKKIVDGDSYRWGFGDLSNQQDGATYTIGIGYKCTTPASVNVYQIHQGLNTLFLWSGNLRDKGKSWNKTIARNWSAKGRVYGSVWQTSSLSLGTKSNYPRSGWAEGRYLQNANKFFIGRVSSTDQRYRINVHNTGKDWGWATRGIPVYGYLPSFSMMCNSGDTKITDTSATYGFKCRKLTQTKPSCGSGYIKTTADDTCSNTNSADSYHCSKDPSYKSGNTLGPIECKKDYIWHNYGCKNDRNIYDYPWEGPALTHFDCKGECGPDGCTCEDVRPQDNCWRGMYTCPINPTQLCTKVVFDGECPDGETVEQIEYKPLEIFSFTGKHRESEFGRTGGYHCGDECGMNIEWIEGRGSKLCVGNALGESSCFDADSDCSFSGRIDAGFDGKRGRYLSGFSVGSTLKTITKAARTWRECDDLLNCTLHSESIEGAITSSCEILGSVGNSRRLGGITSVSSDDRKLVFWDSYQDGEVGSLEIVPKIPSDDQLEGFDYQNDKAAALLPEGFSSIYELDGKTWVLSGGEISSSACAAMEQYGFYRENNNAKAAIRVSDPTRINLPSGNSWCLLARDGSHSFAKQELSIRTIVHEACDDSDKSYDATPLCSRGILNSAIPECVEKTVSTYNAQANCPSIDGIYFDEDDNLCKSIETTATPATVECEDGTDLVDGMCKFVSEEVNKATVVCVDGFMYNKNLDKCQKENVCQSGALNSSSGKCERVEFADKVLKPSSCSVSIDFSYKKEIDGEEVESDQLSNQKEIEAGSNTTISASSGSCSFVSSGQYGCDGTIKATAEGSIEQGNQSSITANSSIFVEDDNSTVFTETVCSVSVASEAPVCPTGYSDHNSSGCQKLIQANPITLYESPNFTCDVLYFETFDEDGQVIDGEFEGYEPDDGEVWELDRFARTCTLTETIDFPTNYECSSGEYDGETSCLHYSTVVHPVSYSCVDQLHIVEDDQCLVESNKIHEPNFICPEGGLISGTKCVKENIPVTHFCSPHTCDSSHLCRVADCVDGYTGTVLTDDLATNYPNSCTDQRCDAWLPYIPYCGLEHGCPPGSVSSEEGCFQMECIEGEFDILNGRCRQWGCPEYSAPKDGKCYR